MFLNIFMLSSMFLQGIQEVGGLESKLKLLFRGWQYKKMLYVCVMKFRAEIRISADIYQNGKIVADSKSIDPVVIIGGNNLENVLRGISSSGELLSKIIHVYGDENKQPQDLCYTEETIGGNFCCN